MVTSVQVNRLPSGGSARSRANVIGQALLESRSEKKDFLADILFPPIFTHGRRRRCLKPKPLRFASEQVVHFIVELGPFDTDEAISVP